MTYSAGNEKWVAYGKFHCTNAIAEGANYVNSGLLYIDMDASDSKVNSQMDLLETIRDKSRRQSTKYCNNMQC